MIKELQKQARGVYETAFKTVRKAILTGDQEAIEASIEWYFKVIDQVIELAVRKTKESVPCEEKIILEIEMSNYTGHEAHLMGYNQHVNEVKEWQKK
jgi:hypothetical protein